VTDCFKTVEHDSFTWNVTITFSGEDLNSVVARLEAWDTKGDFAASARLQHQPLTVWEKYAQVLLLANELVFVD